MAAMMVRLHPQSLNHLLGTMRFQSCLLATQACLGLGFKVGMPWSLSAPMRGDPTLFPEVFHTHHMQIRGWDSGGCGEKAHWEGRAGVWLLPKHRFVASFGGLWPASPRNTVFEYTDQERSGTLLSTLSNKLLSRPPHPALTGNKLAAGSSGAIAVADSVGTP